MFSFTQVQLVAFGLILLVLVAGGTAYHSATVRGLDKQIDAQRKEIYTLGKEKEDLTVRNNALTVENTTFQGMVTSQNSKIEQLQDTINTNMVKADAALKVARAEAKRWEPEYKKVLETVPTGNACEAFERIMGQYLVVRQKELQP